MENNVLNRIFIENWEWFYAKNRNRTRPVVEKEVKKFLGCGSQNILETQKYRQDELP